MRALRRRVAAVQRSLCGIYDLDLGLCAEHFVMDPRRARQLLPPGSPRSGVLVMETAEELELGLYIDPRDVRDPDTIVEETSHLVCLAWHGERLPRAGRARRARRFRAVQRLPGAAAI